MLLAGCHKNIWQNKATAVSDQVIITDSVLLDLRKNYDVLLISQVNYYSYYILAYNKKNWYKIFYFIKQTTSKSEIPYTYKMSKYDKTKGDSILKIFTKNSFQHITEKDEGCYYQLDSCFYKAKTKSKKMELSNSCGEPMDRPAKELLFITKKIAVHKIYNNPEIWEKCLCCTPSKDRQIFLKCYNALMATK